MTQIIVINKSQINGATVETVNARNLHEGLSIGKDFSNWIKAQIKRAMLTEGTDYVTVAQKGVGGQFSAIEYHLTLEAGKHIAMLSGTAKGREVRDYFIECERKAKQAPMVKDARTAALIDALVRQDALEQEQQRQAIELSKVQETLAVVEARTQPENKHFTVLGYANLKGIKLDIGAASKYGRKCAELSRDQGISIGDVSDPRFGRVHSYHESILSQVVGSAS